MANILNSLTKTGLNLVTSWILKNSSTNVKNPTQSINNWVTKNQYMSVNPKYANTNTKTTTPVSTPVQTPVQTTAPMTQNPAYANNQNSSRFIWFQNTWVQNQITQNTKDALNGKTIQNNIQKIENNKASKKTIYIPTQKEQIQNFNKNEEQKYKINQQTVKDLQADMYKNKWPLNEQQLRTYYSEYADKIDEIMDLQNNLRPIVRNWEYVDDAQITQYYKDVLPEQQKSKADEKNADLNIKVLSAWLKGTKNRLQYIAQHNSDVLSDQWKQYLQELIDFSDLPAWIKKNYNIKWSKEEWDILIYALQDPEIQEKLSNLQNYNLTDLDKATINSWWSASKVIDAMSAFQRSLKTASDTYQQYVQAPVNQTVDTVTNTATDYLNNNPNANQIANLTMLWNARQKIQLLWWTAKAPFNMVWWALQWTSDVTTAYDRMSTRQEANSQELWEDVNNALYGWINVWFNVWMPLVTALFNIVWNTDEWKLLIDKTYWELNKWIDWVMKSDTMKDTTLWKFYAQLTPEEQEKFQFNATMWISGLVGKLAKKPAEKAGVRISVAKDAIVNALDRSKLASKFQIWVEKWLADENGKFQPWAVKRIVKEWISEFSDAIKENFDRYNEVVDAREWKFKPVDNTNLEDKRTTGEKVKSEIKNTAEAVKNKVSEVNGVIKEKYTNLIKRKSWNQEQQWQQWFSTTSENDNLVNQSNSTQNLGEINTKPLNTAQSQLLANYNRMNPKAIDTFEEKFWEPYTQYLSERWFTKAWESNLNDMVTYQKDLMEIKENALNKIDWKFNDVAVSDMLDVLQDFYTKTKDRKNLAIIENLQNQHNNGWLSMAEINKARKKFQYDIRTNFFKDWNSEKIQLANNVYLAVKDFLDKTAKENWLDSLDEINREIMKVQHIIWWVTYKMRWSSANNTLWLTDYITLASMLNNPAWMAVFLWKQALKSNAVRDFVLEKAIGRRWNAKNRITADKMASELDRIAEINDVKARNKALEQFYNTYIKPVKELSEYFDNSVAEFKRQFNESVEEWTLDNALPDLREEDVKSGKKNLVTSKNQVTIEVDEKGNARRRWSIWEADNRSEFNKKYWYEKTSIKPYEWWEEVTTTEPEAPKSDTPKEPETKNEITKKKPRKKTEKKKDEWKTIVQKYKEKTNEMYQSIDWETPAEVEAEARDYIIDRLNDIWIYDDNAIVDLAVTWSRSRWIARPDSDLDIVVEINDDLWMREDDLFDILNEDSSENGRLRINWIDVDINPIIKSKTWTLDYFLEKAEEYLSNKAKQNKPATTKPSEEPKKPEVKKNKEVKPKNEVTTKQPVKEIKNVTNDEKLTKEQWELSAEEIRLEGEYKGTEKQIKNMKERIEEQKSKGKDTSYDEWVIKEMISKNEERRNRIEELRQRIDELRVKRWFEKSERERLWEESKPETKLAEEPKTETKSYLKSIVWDEYYNWLEEQVDIINRSRKWIKEPITIDDLDMGSNIYLAKFEKIHREKLKAIQDELSKIPIANLDWRLTPKQQKILENVKSKEEKEALYKKWRKERMEKWELSDEEQAKIEELMERAKKLYEQREAYYNYALEWTKRKNAKDEITNTKNEITTLKEKAIAKEVSDNFLEKVQQDDLFNMPETEDIEAIDNELTRRQQEDLKNMPETEDVEDIDNKLTAKKAEVTNETISNPNKVYKTVSDLYNNWKKEITNANWDKIEITEVMNTSVKKVYDVNIKPKFWAEGTFIVTKIGWEEASIRLSWTKFNVWQSMVNKLQRILNWENIRETLRSKASEEKLEEEKPLEVKPEDTVAGKIKRERPKDLITNPKRNPVKEFTKDKENAEELNKMLNEEVKWTNPVTEEDFKGTVWDLIQWAIDSDKAKLDKLWDWKYWVLAFDEYWIGTLLEKWWNGRTESGIFKLPKEIWEYWEWLQNNPEYRAEETRPMGIKDYIEERKWEEDFEKKGTKEFEEWEFSLLPEEESVYAEMSKPKTSAKRIAPDRVPRQQLTAKEWIDNMLEWDKAISDYIDLNSRMYSLNADERARYSEAKKKAQEFLYSQTKWLWFKSTRSKQIQTIWKNIRTYNWYPEASKVSSLERMAKSLYQEQVKKDIGNGYMYPKEIIDEVPWALTAKEKYEAYIKWWNTSFSKVDERKDTSLRDTIWADLKRQDWKPTTQEFRDYIRTWLTRFWKALWVDVKRLNSDLWLIYIDLNHKNPFLRKWVAWMYTHATRSLSVNWAWEKYTFKDKDWNNVTNTVQTTLAHELTHALDHIVNWRLLPKDVKKNLDKKMNRIPEYMGSSYWHNPAEITARAVEEYVAIKEWVWDSYYDRWAYWNKEIFEKEVAPAIEKAFADKLWDYYKDPESIKYSIINGKSDLTTKSVKQAVGNKWWLNEKQINYVVDQLKKTGLAKDVKLVENVDEFYKELNDKWYLDDTRLQSVWHGSSAEFDKFDSSHMGEWEWAQAHGRGHYVAVNKQTWEHYANMWHSSYEYDGVPLDKYRKDHQYTPFDERDAKSIAEEMALSDVENNWNLDLNELKEAVRINIHNAQYESIRDKYMEVLEALDNIDESKIKKIPWRHLYEVEIPDPVKKNTPTERNYIEEWKKLTEKQWNKFRDAVEKVDDSKKYKMSDWTPVNIDGYYPWQSDTYRLYRQLSQVLWWEKEASKFLESLWYDWIHYFWGRDWEAYVIFNDDALNIKNHIQYLKDYRWDISWATTPDGTVYLIKDNLRGDTPTHEFSHLLRSYAKENNPELFNAINKIAKEAPKELKDYVERTYWELSEDAFLDEVFAWRQGKYSGIKSAERWYQRMWEAIKRAWNSIKSKFWDKYANLDVFKAWEKMWSEELMKQVDKVLKGWKEVKKELKNEITSKKSWIRDNSEYTSSNETRSQQGIAPGSSTSSLYFKDWFWDWEKWGKNVSKVVNADWTPKVVYHWTANKFNEFKQLPWYRGWAWLWVLWDWFYFTDSKKTAKSYSKEKTNNPLKLIFWWNIMETYLDIKKPYELKYTRDADIPSKKDLKAKWYDWIIADMPSWEKYYVAFEPNQIKSATDNVWTYDKWNPDIRFQITTKPQLDQWEVKWEMYHVTPEEFEDFREWDTYNGIDWNTAFWTFVTDDRVFLDNFKEVADKQRWALRGWKERKEKQIDVDAKKVILHPYDLWWVYWYAWEWGKLSESILIDYLEKVWRFDLDTQKNLISLKFLDLWDEEFDYDSYPRKDSYTKEDIVNMPWNVYWWMLEARFEWWEDQNEFLFWEYAKEDAEKLKKEWYDAVKFYEWNTTSWPAYSYALFYPNKYNKRNVTANGKNDITSK